MKYWPLSVIAANPNMPWGFSGEFYAVLNRGSCKLSPACAQMCAHIANTTEPRDAPNMALVQTIDTPDYRLFLRVPTPAEWDGLERSSVMQTEDDLLMLIIAPLH